MYTEDRYFLLLAPNLVVTRVPLNFWTNGTVIGTFFCLFFNFFFVIFYQLLTWMVFERLANSNDYKRNNKLCDLTSQKRNRVQLPYCQALQSLVLAWLLTVFCYSNQ